MYIPQRKRVLAAAIATLLAAPAWTTSVNASEHAKPNAEMQTGSEKSKMSDTERSSGTGTSTSQSGSAYGSGGAASSGAAGTGTTSGSAGAATSAAGTGSASQSTGSGTTTGDSMRSTTGQSAAGKTMTGTTSMGSGATGRMAANPLYSRSADDLKGTDVVDVTGDKIGDIKEVVLSMDRRSAHAVIGVGGFLGMGEHDIAVSLEELKTHEGDELQLSATKEQLEARPKYQSEQYVKLEGDQAISGSITDFAAFETDRDSRTGTGRDSSMGKSMDKDKDTRLPSTGSGTSTGTGASSGTDTGTESKSSTTK